MLKLFENQTVDGDGPIFSTKGSTRTLILDGNLGGGTVTIFLSKDNVTWVTAPDLIFTETIAATFVSGAGVRVKANLAGSTGADVSLFLI